jgi:hypothetical protein
MKIQNQLFSYSLLRPFLFFFLLLISAAAISAQIPAIFRDVRYVEWEQKNQKRVNPSVTSNQVNWEQTRRYFVKLQVASEQLRLSLKTDADNFQKIRAKVGKVKRFANRLKRDLPLPKLDERIVSLGAGTIQLDAAVAELDRIVIRFAENPFFKQKQVIDVQSGVVAGKDLEIILAMCESLGKRVEKLAG